MSSLGDVVLLPFTLALEIVDVVLWVTFAICEAAFTLTSVVVWLLMAALELVLRCIGTIVGLVLFEWLPMLARLFYGAVLFTTPIAWRWVEAIFWTLNRVWTFVYNLPWRSTFVTVVTTVWDYSSSAASLLHRQGSYAAKEVSRINYRAILEHLSETYALILTAILISVIACVVIWYSEQRESQRESSSEERRERELRLRRRSELRQRRRSRCRSASGGSDNKDEGDSNTMSTSRIASNKSSANADNSLQELYTDSLKWNTELISESELLRRRLHRANEELSQERDKFLCVVCQDLKREVILKPCNHYCLCHDCSSALRECPICKSGIEDIEKIYHA